MPAAAPPTVDQYRALRHVVAQIEVELKNLQLWEPAPPPADTLTSTVPFSVDTLDFHQWLQWQFLPKMRRILLGHGQLPDSSQIFPYALDCFLESERDSNELLFLLRSFDELISGDGLLIQTQ
jgi:uncharacterized protein YqcC (DUF446 family)